MPNKRAEPRWADLTVAARTRLLLRGLLGLGEGGVRALEEQIAEVSRRLELTYTHDDGKTHVIPLLGTPALLARADAEYLRGLCLLLLRAFKKTVNARARDPEIQAILPGRAGEA